MAMVHKMSQILFRYVFFQVELCACGLQPLNRRSQQTKMNFQKCVYRKRLNPNKNVSLMPSVYIV